MTATWFQTKVEHHKSKEVQPLPSSPVSVRFSYLTKHILQPLSSSKLFFDWAKMSVWPDACARSHHADATTTSSRQRTSSLRLHLVGDLTWDPALSVPCAERNSSTSLHCSTEGHMKIRNDPNGSQIRQEQAPTAPAKLLCSTNRCFS